MALPTFTVDHPSQKDGTGSNVAMLIEEFTGLVEHQLTRASKLSPMVNFRQVRGTNTISKAAIGSSGSDVRVAGASGIGTPSNAPVAGTDATVLGATSGRVKAKNLLTLDRLLFARDWIPIEEDIQSMYETRVHYARTQGEKLGRDLDQSLFIQAAKAALLTTSAYGSAITGAAGFGVGNQYTFSTAGDEVDPSKLYSAIAAVLEKMTLQDVDVFNSGLVIALPPQQFFALNQSQYIINGEYVTAQGNATRGYTFQAWGLPVIVSNNIPQTNITSHFMGTDYVGDFSKVKGLIFSPDRALLAGQSINLTSSYTWEEIELAYLLQSYLMFNAKPDRAEFAGVILAA